MTLYAQMSDDESWRGMGLILGENVAHYVHIQNETIQLTLKIGITSYNVLVSYSIEPILYALYTKPDMDGQSYPKI